MHHYPLPCYSFVYPTISTCSASSLLQPSFLSDLMSAAIHSKQQVMDLARDLIWLWMSQPVGVRVGVRMDTEKPATTTHTLSLWDFFSLSFSLAKVQHQCCPHTERKQPEVQRGLSGRSVCTALIPAVLPKPSLRSQFDLVFFFKSIL